MEAEDSGAAGRTDRAQPVGAQQEAGITVGRAAKAPEAAGTEAPDGAEAAESQARGLSPTLDADADVYAGEGPDSSSGGTDVEGSEPDADTDLDAERAARKGRPVSSGIGCAALLLPLIAVAGAILCFAAGILSTVTGCTPNGSALCSANGAWFEFALPLFVSPVIAAATAIGAVTVRRHRSTWLAVGYGIVFISVIVGLASASTGSN